MLKWVKVIYLKWVSWRILSAKARIANNEEKLLKLLLKQSKNEIGEKNDKIPYLNAKLRLYEYSEKRFDSTEEKVNHAYHKFKHHGIVYFFGKVLSATRKYRLLTGIFAYGAVIFSALQMWASVIFSSAVVLAALPFLIAIYVVLFVPLRIRSLKYGKSIYSKRKSIYYFITENVSYKTLKGFYAGGFVSQISENGVCLITSGAFCENFFIIRKISDSVYVCSERFISFYQKRFDAYKPNAVIKI